MKRTPLIVTDREIVKQILSARYQINLATELDIKIGDEDGANVLVWRSNGIRPFLIFSSKICYHWKHQLYTTEEYYPLFDQPEETDSYDKKLLTTFVEWLRGENNYQVSVAIRATCCYCGQLLTSIQSIERGYGNFCYRYKPYKYSRRK